MMVAGICWFLVFGLGLYMFKARGLGPIRRGERRVKEDMMDQCKSCRIRQIPDRRLRFLIGI